MNFWFVSNSGEILEFPFQYGLLFRAVWIAPDGGAIMQRTSRYEDEIVHIFIDVACMVQSGDIVLFSSASVKIQSRNEAGVRRTSGRIIP